MIRSINFNNFKKVITVATVFTIAACLVPESALAGVVTPSGRSGNNINFSFDLNLDLKNNEGFFPEVIQEFKVEPSTSSDVTTSLLCGEKVDFCSGSIKVTKLFQINGIIPGLDFGLSELNKLLDSGIALGNFNRKLKPNFSNNVFKYDVKLDSNPDSELIWFIESNDSSLLNDLSGLSQFPGALGIFPALVRMENNESKRQGGVFEISLQSVPEPTSTASLLGMGALGAVSLLKRKKPLKKTHGLNQ